VAAFMGGGRLLPSNLSNFYGHWMAVVVVGAGGVLLWYRASDGHRSDGWGGGCHRGGR